MVNMSTAPTFVGRRKLWLCWVQWKITPDPDKCDKVLRKDAKTPRF
jgi:hypothetical protein